MTRADCYTRMRDVLRHNPFAMSLLDRLEEGEKFGEAAFAARAAGFKDRVNVHTVINILDSKDIDNKVRDALRNKNLIQRRAVEAMRAEFPGLAPDYFLAPGSVWKNRSTFDLVRVLEIDYMPDRRVKYYYLDSNVEIKRETNGFLADFQYVGPDIYAAMASRLYRPERVVAKHVTLAERYHCSGVVGLRAGEVPAILSRGEEVRSADLIRVGSTWLRKSDNRQYTIDEVHPLGVRIGKRWINVNHFRYWFTHVSETTPKFTLPVMPTVGTRWRRKDNGVNYKVQSCDFTMRGDSFEQVNIHLVPSNQLAVCTCTVEGPLEVFYEHFESIP